jgi:hemoglobin
MGTPADSPKPPDRGPSDFEKLGGEERLRAVIDRFVDRVMDDMMIGFFFAKVDRKELKRLEYEFAAGHLGAKTAYTGRPIELAHAKHPILGGQFNRRLKILERTLAELNVPADVAERWLAHNQRLRPLITRDSSQECDPTRARERVLEAEARELAGPRKVDVKTGSGGEHGS